MFARLAHFIKEGVFKSNKKRLEKAITCRTTVTRLITEDIFNPENILKTVLVQFGKKI